MWPLFPKVLVYDKPDHSGIELDLAHLRSSLGYDTGLRTKAFGL
jgi:hypothetical protein